jgi:hypothetical protein
MGSCVGDPDSGIRVLVGRGATLVEGTNVTVELQAIATKRTIEINRRGFFTIVLCMAEFPFMLKHTHPRLITPLSMGEFLLSTWIVSDWTVLHRMTTKQASTISISHLLSNRHSVSNGIEKPIQAIGQSTLLL